MEDEFTLVEDKWARLFNALMRISEDLKQLNARVGKLETAINFIVKEDARSLNWAIRKHVAIPFHAAKSDL